MSFDTLGLPAELLRAVAEEGYRDPTQRTLDLSQVEILVLDEAASHSWLFQGRGRDSRVPRREPARSGDPEIPTLLGGGESSFDRD